MRPLEPNARKPHVRFWNRSGGVITSLTATKLALPGLSHSQTSNAVPGDLKNEAYCQQLVASAVQQLGRLDLLANIAGKQLEVPDIADLTTEQFDETFKTNVYALFWMCKAALQHMPAGSTIINTASEEVYQQRPNLLGYASTKAAINAFSKALAKQVANKGIRVNVVALGPVWTPLEVSGGQPTEKLSQFGAETALGRLAQPAELAPAYVFLASAESSFAIGETLSVTGGMAAP